MAPRSDVTFCVTTLFPSMSLLCQATRELHQPGQVLDYTIRTTVHEHASFYDRDLWPDEASHRAWNWFPQNRVGFGRSHTPRSG